MIIFYFVATTPHHDSSHLFWGRDMKGLILGAVIETLLSGCVYTGINFDESKLANVNKGEATKQEIISCFGNPSITALDSDQRRY